jgi:hypothetical protein
VPLGFAFICIACLAEHVEYPQGPCIVPSLRRMLST